MLQAGAWLEGAHLISALGSEPNDAGIGLLKQPEVVAYLEYVQKQGEGRAESAVLETLEATPENQDNLRLWTRCRQKTSKPSTSPQAWCSTCS